MLSIGNQLRDARHHHGIDLTTCETATKIRAKYLTAMEEERFEVLPEPVFVKGMLRTYAQYLGLDPEPLLDEYRSRFTEPDPHSPPGGPTAGTVLSGRSPATRGGPRRTNTRMVALAIGAILVITALVWLGSRGDDNGTADITVTQSTTPRVLTGEVADPATSNVPVLVVMGTSDGGTQVQIRRGGPRGEVVFRGRLAEGGRTRVRVSENTWVQVRQGGSVVARLNGRAIDIPPGKAMIVTRTGVQGNN